jgi:TonB family protein
MTRHGLSCFVAVALVAALAAPMALAQDKPREVAPEPAQGTSSQEMSSVLDLAKIYFAQGRYEEAQGMLARAQGILARMRVTTTAPIDARIPVSTTLPPGVVRIGGNIKPPTKIHDVSPEYPPEARAGKVQGLVIVEAIIDPQGNVTDARVLRGVPLLDDAALTAVRQWTFTPTLMNGVPVSVAMTVTVNFRLGQ